MERHPHHVDTLLDAVQGASDRIGERFRDQPEVEASIRRALAATLAGQFQLDVDYAHARGYDTALEAYMDKDGIDTKVYDNLVSTINANLPLLHRYVELRKKALGLDEIHLYDLYIPIVEGVAVEVPFADARVNIIAALEPLGADYGAALAEGLDPTNGWMDLYPHRDKGSGAFSVAVHGPHPYVFMNYQDSLDDMSTLAHEFGHALHSDLAMKAQPYSSFRYPAFLAEVASTCNESLLSEFLVSKATDPAEKAYLLVERLETIRGTIFRQTMFAEFERQVHGFVEEGTPITAALLEETYSGLVQRYYGPGYTFDENDGMEWAYIPHFYYKYYVYSYATGLSSGIAIADRVKTLGKPAADAFLAMLAGGASAPPLELLAGAGVEYAVVDDYHFRCAGLRDKELFAYYIAEDRGKLLRMFSGSQFLRYAIPFRDPEEIIEYLRDCATEDGNSIVVYSYRASFH